MIIKIKYHFNKKYILKKIEINHYRNKMITETTKNTDFKDLVRSYVELENKLKALEEIIKINESEKH